MKQSKFLTGAMKFWTLLIGVGALAGALMMWIDPTGAMWQLDPILEMLRAKMPWPDIFFKSFIPSSFVLLAVNGLTQYAAAFMLFKKHRYATLATLLCGIILMCWIVLEWCIFGFYGICNLFFAFGFLETATAVAALLIKE